MAVREYDRGQIVAVFLEEIKIRDRDIDAVWRFLGKAHAGIDNDHFVGIADAHAVHPELADAAKRYYLNFAHKSDPTSPYIRIEKYSTVACEETWRCDPRASRLNIKKSSINQERSLFLRGVLGLIPATQTF